MYVKKSVLKFKIDKGIIALIQCYTLLQVGGHFNALFNLYLFISRSL